MKNAAVCQPSMLSARQSFSLGCLRWFTPAMIMLLLITTAKTQLLADDEDIVHIRDAESEEVTTRRGLIVEWNQTFLELQTISGRPTKISTADVARIQTTYQPQHLLGDQQFSQSAFLDARQSYREAFEAETRLWVKRMLLAKVVAISRLEEENELACREFLRICANQPDHRFWEVAPIPWRAETPDGGVTAAALSWLESDDPTENLVGAAWLINSSHRSDATETLRELSRGDRSAIGKLATVQLWRLDADADESTIRQWLEQLEAFPPELHSGPRFVIGRRMAATRQYEQAALQFMNVRILHPNALDLSAMSLFEAGRALSNAENLESAAIVQAELKQSFPDTIWAQQVDRQ